MDEKGADPVTRWIQIKMQIHHLNGGHNQCICNIILDDLCFLSFT